MLKEEIINIGGKDFVRHYTDEPIYDDDGNELPRLFQVETGAEYIEAVDVIPCPYTYIELPKPELNVEPELEQAAEPQA